MLHDIWFNEANLGQKKERITYHCHWNEERERNKCQNFHEPDVIPFNTSNHPPPLSVPIYDDEGFTDNDYFYGTDAGSEGENVDFGTHNQPQAAPSPPDTHPPVPNEDPEGDKTCSHGQGPDKQYPDHVWKLDENDIL